MEVVGEGTNEYNRNSLHLGQVACKTKKLISNVCMYTPSYFMLKITPRCLKCHNPNGKQLITCKCINICTCMYVCVCVL